MRRSTGNTLGIWISALLFFAALGGIAVVLENGPVPPNPVGLFRLTESLTFLDIQRTTDSQLVLNPIPGLVTQDWHLEEHGERILILQHRTQSNDRYDTYTQGLINAGEARRDPKTGRFDWFVFYEIYPSASVPGDYDGFPHYPGQVGRDAPLPSLLHRENDRAVLDYARLLPFNEHTTSEQFKAVAAQLTAHAPNDPFIALYAFDALVAVPWSKDYLDTATLTALIEKWRPQWNQHPTLRHALTLAENDLRAAALGSSNGLAALRSLVFHQNTLADWSDKLLRLREFHDLALVHSPFDPMPFRNGLLLMQVMARTICIESLFAALRGDSDLGLDQLAALYHMGQLMSQHDKAIFRLIGIAIRNIASDGLGFYALNVCSTAEDYQRLLITLDALNRHEQPQSPAQMFALEPAGALLKPQDLLASTTLGNVVRESWARQRVADDRFQLARVAAAARWQHELGGHYPTDPKNFTVLLAVVPNDTFTSQPLRFNATPQEFRVWSPGPDANDNHSDIDYDPTNGTFSAGDLVLRAPTVSRYPIGHKGVRATTAAAFWRQLPNGLPPDPYADSKGQPFKLSETSTTLQIFSWGPDTDESWAQPGKPTFTYAGKQERAYPEVQYDPTNGTTSNGDLIMNVLPY